ncbi:hypothetical protein Tco_0729087 [Tanacetum coccineum]|uniref:Uncharacterized protein n=1 Tax=Tanacetum coccineum TaxID=301880 RepID=A0ABQ4YP12_9ASTR
MDDYNLQRGIQVILEASQAHANKPIPTTTDIHAQVVSMSASISTPITQDAPSTSMSSSSSNIQASVLHQCIAAGPNVEDDPFFHAVPHP